MFADMKIWNLLYRENGKSVQENCAFKTFISVLAIYSFCFLSLFFFSEMGINDLKEWLANIKQLSFKDALKLWKEI